MDNHLRERPAVNAEDLRKIVGASQEPVEYAPVAMLLKTGYACFGHYNGNLNEDLGQTLVVLNAQLMDLKAEAHRTRPAAEDFREFLLEIVGAYDSQEQDDLPTREFLGKPIPLVAIPLEEIAIVYPVAQIVTMLQRISPEKREEQTTPALFDFNRSEILTVLRMKLW